MTPKSSPFRDSLSFEVHYPYLLAVSYVLIVSAAIGYVFPTPPPRFMDIYLIGIALVHSRWSAGPAWVIYLLSLVFAAWLLPKSGTMVITEGYNVYRMISYSVTSLILMRTIEKLKSRSE
jgi:hypothetical protein